MDKLPVIHTDPSQSEDTVVILNNMQVLEAKLENMPAVENKEQAELVSEYRAQFKKQSKSLDAERLSMTSPLRELTTRLNQKYNVHIERAERAGKLADSLLMPWMRAQRKIREDAEEAERVALAEEAAARQVEEDAIAEAQRIAAETQSAAELQDAEVKVTAAKAGLNKLRTRPVMPTVAKTLEGTLGSQTGLREIWKYRVTDILLVPEQYLVDPADRIRKGELNAIAKRDKKDAFVPGIEFYKEDSLTSKAATNL